MNQADLDKARAEIDPLERAFRSLKQVEPHLLGFLLLAEKYRDLATLNDVMEKAQADAKQAQTRLEDLNDAVGAAEVAQAEQYAQFDALRKERERVLDSLGRNIEASKAQATEIVAAARLQAEQIVEAAKEAWKEAVEAAAAKAAEIRASAEAEARAIIAAANDQAAEAKHAAAGYQATLRDMEKAAAKAEERLSRARAAIFQMAAETKEDR